MLFTLTYVSRATRDFTPDELGALAEQSRRDNAARHVTGVLLFAEGRFVQRLEGARDTVAALYARIARDKRHTIVLTTDVRDLTHRVFAGWGMGFLDARTMLNQEPDEFWSRLPDTLLNDPTQADSIADRLRALLG